MSQQVKVYRELQFLGAGTGVHNLTMLTNLADALSVKDSAGDLIVFNTTTGSQGITITPATTITGALTANGGATIVGNSTITGLLSGHKQDMVAKTANYTLLAADSGKWIEAGAVDLVFTLPSTAEGLTYTFVVKTLSATTGCSISPAAADKIMGNGFTSADNKDAINTAATDREGDMITVVGDGVDGWYITAVVGTWAKEA